MCKEADKFYCLFLVALIMLPVSPLSDQSFVKMSLVNNCISSPVMKPDVTEAMRISSSVYDHQSTSEVDLPSPVTGIMNPVTVEQSGYSETDSISARTDTGTNTKQNLTIDTVHNWMASIAELNIQNLKKIYAENGTFNEGYPGTNLNPTGNVAYHPLGWDAVSMTGDSAQIQSASYFAGTESYVIVENQGVPVGPATDRDYEHTLGTNVTWTQNATNYPFSEDFILSFRFLYFRGPIGGLPTNSCSIVVCVDGKPVWNTSLVLVEQRGIWFDSGEIPIAQEGIGSTFKIDVGLSIDDTMVLDPNSDYDSDGTVDGIQNTYFITVFLDDFCFESATPPSCEEVDLGFSVDGFSTAVVGEDGTGYSQIGNEFYWNKSSIELSITSNSSLSFTYIARLLNHRFLNSCCTTDILEEGVTYAIESEKSGLLELYTYLGFLEDYEELILKIHHPHDWENCTVFDPFMSDVTSICILTDDWIEVPDSISERLGWWKVVADSPNYVSSVTIERFESSLSTWVDDSIFHSFDLARINASIGTSHETPALQKPVDFTWVFPNCTVWQEASSIGGAGAVISPSVVFGPTNTSAGVWGVAIMWTNGSELAYRCRMFELHHNAALELVFSDNLETVVGQPLTIILRFIDTENGKLILSDEASLIGQWDGPNMEFVVDTVNNWWEADFDTTDFGSGHFAINITSHTPCFDADALEIIIYSYYLTSLVAEMPPMSPLIYGRQYNFSFTYTRIGGIIGIDGATIEVTEEGSEWTSVEEDGRGHYVLSIRPLASGDYRIRIRFSKVGYENQTHILTFLVNDVEMRVGSISSLVGNEFAPLRIEVEIEESDTGNLVTDANVTFAIYGPGNLLYQHTMMTEESSGVYSTSILMPGIVGGPYTVRISAEKDNHRMTQVFSAELVPTFDLFLVILHVLIAYPWQIGLMAALVVVGIIGHKAWVKRRREKHAAAIAFKDRLNDASNILGIIVLHKLSGVPIYSQVFKGGFEEGLLSAFISAIMQFRESIDAGKPGDYALVPISEVMRAVPTENLICAFITMTPPSKEQEAKMVDFARAIGMMFDDTLAVASAEVIDEEKRMSFELFFDNLMDGNLIRKYRLGDRKLPRSLKLLDKALHIEEIGDRFVLSTLVRILIAEELSTDDIYINVLKAIDEEYILPVFQYIDERDRSEL